MQKNKNLFYQLDDIINECVAEDWDGYNAAPVTKKTYLNAVKILKILEKKFHDRVKDFEISPGADGSLIFEYRKNSNSIFTVSVDESADTVFVLIDNDRNIKISGKTQSKN